jgi:F-type H+-transporting ATPase subunit delta
MQPDTQPTTNNPQRTGKAMAKTTHSSQTVLSYAEALLGLAAEQGQADEIGAELHDLNGIFDQFPAFIELLRNPGIGEAERTDALNKVLQGKISPLLWNFIRVLAGHNRLGLLSELDAAYDHLLDERHGRIEVDVTVAQKLTDEQLERVRGRVGQALNKQAVVHQYVDEKIIGGLILRVGDKLIDASVRQQLNSIKKQILSARDKAVAAAG